MRCSFIFLIASQFFFVKLFNNNEINIFKYSGLKNSKIIYTLGTITFLMGILMILIFYNFSSYLQGHYLEIKNRYSTDKSYLAVINKNGLWIKDIVNEEISIINSSKINKNILENTFITTFDKDFNLIRNIKSNKIDIKNKNWLIYDATIYENNVSKKVNHLNLKTNFNQKRIESMFSNLSSLSVIKLFNLRENYKSLNYSLVDVDIQISKILTYPIYLMLMTLLASIIMFNTKNLKSNTFKLVVGLFFSVIIYYMTNFFNVIGSTEKIKFLLAVLSPLLILSFMNTIMLFNINEK